MRALGMNSTVGVAIKVCGLMQDPRAGFDCGELHDVVRKLQAELIRESAGMDLAGSLESTTWVQRLEQHLIQWQAAHGCSEEVLR